MNEIKKHHLQWKNELFIITLNPLQIDLNYMNFVTIFFSHIFVFVQFSSHILRARSNYCQMMNNNEEKRVLYFFSEKARNFQMLFQMFYISTQCLCHQQCNVDLFLPRFISRPVQENKIIFFFSVILFYILVMQLHLVHEHVLQTGSIVKIKMFAHFSVALETTLKRVQVLNILIFFFFPFNWR